ncbi:MAG: thiamine diphosphokinase [Bacillota bacterium]
MHTIIVCNGSIIDYPYYKKYFDKAEFIICADGGASHLKSLGIIPNVLLGDFDSISGQDLDYYMKLNVEVLKFPREKDMTDTELAVSVACDRGFKDVVIIGGTGTRLDHSLSNIYLLKKMLDKGIRGRIVNEYNEIALMSDSIKVDYEDGFNLTLLPLTERVEGITTKGLYYELRGDTLEIGSSRGVSNEFVSSIAEITITSGILLVIKSKD